MTDDPVIKSWAITVQTVRAEIFHVPPEDMRRIFQRIEALTSERDRLRAALTEWDALIEHQYSGSREAMSAMTEAAQRTARVLKGETP